jgi:hypothetical protein
MTTHNVPITFGTDATVLVWDALIDDRYMARPVGTYPGLWFHASPTTRARMAAAARADYLRTV